MTRRPGSSVVAGRGLGLGLVVLYAVVAAATHGLSSRAVRPLFDGFAPQVPYRWVKPPPEFAADNQPPQPAQRTIPLGDGGSEATNASTTDAQIIVTLQRGAVPVHPPDTSVALTITPLDAGTLAPLPSPLRAVSNAYQVTLAYQPSQTPVTQASSATIALTAASQGDALLYSADGRQWQSTSARPFGNTHGLLGPFTPGYYVVGVSAATTTTTQTGSGGGSGSAAVIVGVGLVGAAVLVVAGLALRGRRSGRRRRGRGRGRPRSRRP